MYQFRYLHGKKACAIMNGTGIRSIAKWHLEQRGMRNGGQDHTAQRSELFLRERRGQRESEAARSGHSGMRQHRGAARHRTDGVLPGKAQRRQDRHGELAGGQGVSGANLCTAALRSLCQVFQAGAQHLSALYRQDGAIWNGRVLAGCVGEQAAAWRRYGDCRGDPKSGQG